MRLVLQQTEQDCLLACFSMILDDYGIRRHPWQLSVDTEAGADGLSSTSLRALCKEYGLSVKGYRGSGQALMQGLHDIHPACIVHFKNNHFVVVVRRCVHRLDVFDPAIGIYSMTPDELMECSSGAIFFFTLTDSETAASQRSLNRSSHTIARVLSSFSKDTHILILLSYLLAQVGTLTLSWGLKYIVDESISTTASITIISLIVILTLLSIIIKVVGIDKGTKSFDRRYSNRLFDGLLSKPSSYFSSMSRGALMERLNLRMTVRDSVLNTIIAEAASALTSIIIVFYIACLNFQVAALIIGVSAVFLLANQVIVVRQRSATIRYIQSQQDFGGIAQRELSGIEERIASGETDFVRRKWISSNDALTKAYMDVIKASSWTQGLSNVYTLLMGIVLALYSAVQFKNGSMSLGTMMVIQVAGGLIQNGVKDTLSLISNCVSLKLNAERHDDLFEQQGSQYFVDEEHQSGPLIKAGDLSGRHGDKIIFDHANITVNSGSTTYIVGPSGAGKTSLVKALIGVERHGGTLNLEKDLRRGIGVSLAEPEFGGETVRDTICIDETSTDAMLWKMLRDVGLEQRIRSFPLGLDSKISEDGKNLSNGEKKRLALARALVSGKQLVVLDEPFNGLDGLTKYDVFRSLRQYEDRALITVTHDLALIGGDDQVIFLDGSGEVRLGLHRELMSKSIEYRRFCTPPNTHQN